MSKIETQNIRYIGIFTISVYIEVFRYIKIFDIDHIPHYRKIRIDTVPKIQYTDNYDIFNFFSVRKFGGKFSHP